MIIARMGNDIMPAINQKRNATVHKIHRIIKITSILGSMMLCCLAITACAPTVKVEAPQEPITINLNVKLDADIRVKLEEEAKKDIEANPNVF